MDGGPQGAELMKDSDHDWESGCETSSTLILNYRELNYFNYFTHFV